MSVILSPSPRIYYICSEKCGEIKMTNNAMHFQLICEFCTKVYTDLGEFIKHLQVGQCKGGLFEDTRITIEGLKMTEETNIGQMDKDTPSQKVAVAVSAIEIEEDIPADPLEFVSATVKKENPSSDTENDMNVEHVEEEQPTKEAEQQPTSTAKLEASKAQLTQNTRLVYLIKLLKNYNLLWSKQHPNHGNRIMRDAAYTKITNLINKRFTDKHYSKTVIVKMLNGLIILYKKMRYGKMPKLWYFDNLNFLNEQKRMPTSSSNNFTAKVTLLKPDANNRINLFSDASGEPVSDTTSRSNMEETISENSNASQMIDDAAEEKEEGDNDMEEEEEETAEQKKNKLIHSKEVTLALIELFQAQRSLWDRANANFYKATERTDHYQRFAVTLNERFNLTLNSRDVRNRMRPLVEARHKNYISAPYYNDLSFIPRIGKSSRKCQYCDETFSRHTDLEQHEYEHTKVKSIKCQQCPKSFITMEALRCHQKIHLPKEQFAYVCEECGERLRTPALHREHQYRMHNVPWPLTCEVCKRGFSKQSLLKIHMRWHTGEKCYLCTVCGKSYTTNSALKEHLDRHAKLKAYPCEICENSYYTQNKLKTHMKVHYNIKDHECDVCGKKFVVKYNLTIHKQIHSNERNYECQLCGQRFKQASSRAGHMRKHREAEGN